ncbi:P-loop NTPase fold protein [Porphyromonas sp.]
MKNHYNYISKAPCGEDLFVGKAHQKTAEQIAQRIFKAKKSLMIGIEGSWGSGKSNLITMIETELKKLHKKEEGKVTEAIFFNYDAWGHQNDMPRRAMLEELTSKIVQATQALKEGKRKDWEERKEKLLAQRKKTSTKTIPKVSAGILVLALMSILTPTCSKVGESLPKTYGAGWDIAITIVPLAFGLCYAGYKFYRLKKKTVKAFLNELLFLYQESTKEETTHEVVFSEEPSSSQFREWMKDLDKSLQTHLILVFDNMDRLPASKVQEFWAAIHSFFSEEKYKHIRVIIPFDRKHIISAFKGEDSGDKRCYGNDFIDKTFDVVYRVAPPTLSNWKGYLSAQWEEAFGESLSPEHSITQIYDLLTESKTPREIIAFINDCVTTSETCSASIPDEYIALFVIGKHKINESPQKELLELSFLEPLAYKYRNEKTQKYLSALYYQLPPEEVLDIVYTDQLRRELEKGETTLLKSLVGQPILPSLLENAIVAVTNIENTALAFSQVEAEAKEKEEQDKSIPINFWEQLLMKAPEEKEDCPKKYQIELLKHTSEESAKRYLRDVITSIYSLSYGYISKSGASNPKIFDAPKFHNKITRLQEGIEEHPYLNPIELLHEVVTTPERFVSFVQQAQEKYEDYKVSCPIEEVDTYLSEMAIEELKDLHFTRYLSGKEKVKLRSFFETLRDQIKDSNSTDEASILLHQWVDLGIRDITSKGDSLMSDNLIRTLYEDADKGSFLEHCLICIYISRGKARTIPAMEDILREENEELSKEIAQKYIQIFVTYEDLLLMHSDMREYPLYRGIVRTLIANKLGKRLSVEKVLPQYKEISQTIGISEAELLTEWNHYPKNGITEETIQRIPVEFFSEDTEAQHLELVSHCKQVAVEGLRSIELVDWKDHFLDRSHEYLLLIEIKCDCPNAYEAFKQVITTELSDQKIILSNETYEELVSLFNGQRKRWGSALQTARDRYSEMGKSITPDLFLRYGTDLIKQGDLPQKPNAIPTLLPTVLLTKQETLEILNKNSHDVDLILSAAGEEYKQEFSNQAQSIYSQEIELSKKMTELMSALGMMPES